MVKLEPVEDEHFAQQQPGPEEDENDYTDTDSEISSISSASSSAPIEETIADRLHALKDILPPKQRAVLSSSVNKGFSWVKSGLTFGGKTLWVVSTSALLLGVPWAMAFQEELTINEMEKEQKMQQSANELLAPGANQEQPGQQQGTKPAL
ncbi:MAG: mitochondrial import receptor protein [Sclerophora amabilis]|nr:MAG: mitochondrial import receptor protein [Sclerophora amabilis]